ncbi:hypothetical protein QEZ54_13880 [Catellatospora sp. KI3]|uniref:hypothetical protein n=1 Tax=Catellatospora sp. KI3 TaxID=3041620 RepID=UPI0024828481|nr:hypothetical protein [Catellatospora sp. KI3]MDI1462060.1 hypothetical protein [Catellatospora sp. KI3]
MTTRFPSIGVDVRTQDELRDLMATILGAAEPVQVDRERCDHVWTCPSAARVVVQARGGLIAGVLTGLAGSAPTVACTDVRLLDDRVATLNLLDETEGNLLCSVAAQLEDHSLLRLAGGLLARGQVVLSVLADRITAYPDLRSYQQETGARLDRGHLLSQELRRPPAAPGDWAPTAEVDFTATVRRAELRVNSLTGTAFHWLRLSVRPALELDLAAGTAELAAPPAPGSVVTGRGLLTGRLNLRPGDLPRQPGPARALLRRVRHRITARLPHRPDG